MYLGGDDDDDDSITKGYGSTCGIKSYETLD